MTMLVACITLFDQLATFTDVTYQKIPRNSTGAVAEIWGVAYLCVESERGSVLRGVNYKVITDQGNNGIPDDISC